MTIKAKKYRLRKGEALTPTASVAAPADVGHQPLAGTDPSRVSAAKARKVSTETNISEIRREGLTGRQLRMARRTAQRHGLSPNSDHDAVRLLRERGIDPFQRAPMLELVSANPDGDSTGGAFSISKTEADPGRAAARETMQKPQEARQIEILRIQQDIARRRRRNTVLLAVRLALFVLLPTFVAGWYFAFVATPMYATNAELVIQQADSADAGSLGGAFQGTGLAMQQDSTTVQSYLQSRDAMLRLDADKGFRAHFSQPFIDPVRRLAADASNEDVYELYQRNVKVGFDPTEGLLKMEVVAADPDVGLGFASALIGYAEEQVDNLTRRLREDQMSGARDNYEAAERNVREAQEAVLALQEELGVLDPATETGSLMQQITTFEVQLREKQLQLEQLLANPAPNGARVNGVRGDITRLEAMVGDLRASMTASGTGGASLARIAGQLRIAEADLTTRQMLLQQAAQQKELARIEANRQVRYMAIGVPPVAPDEPTYPHVFENTLLAFLIFAGIYLMVSLTVSVLREQIST